MLRGETSQEKGVRFGTLMGCIRYRERLDSGMRWQKRRDGDG